jgi:SAM-dependent methyltransferase
VSYADRARAGSFGEDAAQYDRGRPTYPAQMIDDLMAEGPADAVDVGCGTGIVARLLLARGCRVVGVEADPRMASVAQQRGVDVEVARFEEWDDCGRRFDLLTSGQAWHWVEPEAGIRKAASVLRPGGRLALFWNGLTLPNEVLEAISPIYRRLAPEQLKDSVALGTTKPTGTRDAEMVEASGLFIDVEHRVYEWEDRTPVATWIDGLATHSGHRLLPPDVLRSLIDGVTTALQGYGDDIVIAYSTAGAFARTPT